MEAGGSVDAESWISIMSKCVRTRGARAGLAQAGNTCYLAGSLQCLYETEGWKQFLTLRQCSCGEELCGSCLLAGTYEGIVASVDAVDLHVWKPMIQFLGLEKHRQQDPHEFWNLFMAKWSEHSVTARADNAMFLDIVGSHTSERICTTPQCTCGIEWKTVRHAPVESNLYVFLSLGEARETSSVAKLLEYYFAERIMETKDLGRDDCCGCGAPYQKKQQTRIVDRFSVSPSTFCVFLKRSLLDGGKDFRPVDLDAQLTLLGHKFRLQSVLLHLGQRSGGHYVAWIRQWIRQCHIYDDSQIYEYQGTTPEMWQRSAVMATYTAMSVGESAVAVSVVQDAIVKFLGEGGGKSLRGANTDTKRIPQAAHDVDCDADAECLGSEDDGSGRQDESGHEESLPPESEGSEDEDAADHDTGYPNEASLAQGVYLAEMETACLSSTSMYQDS